MSEGDDTWRQRRLGEFRDAARERLSTLNLTWIQLEHGEADAAAELARELHGLKGESALFGHAAAARALHAIEDVLALACAGQEAGVAAHGDRVLEGLDVVAALLEGEPCERHESVDAFVAAVAQLKRPEEPGEPGKPDRPARPAQHAPPAAAATAERPAAEPPPPARTAVAAAAARAAAAVNDSTRVSARSLDHIRDVVGELLLTTVRLERAASELARVSTLAHAVLDDRRTAPSAAGRDARLLLDGLGGVSQALRAARHELSGHVDQLEGTVRDLRMSPLRMLFDELPAEARGLARKLGRDARVTLQGGDVLADRTVIERLRTPLLHLLRNAVDHGIEPPEQRMALGKPRAGQIFLCAWVEKGRLLVEVNDDGAGVDREAIRRRAVELGIFTPAQAEAAVDGELLRTLFHAGFSTRRSTSETSGRGVGLDAVRTAALTLGGDVEIASSLPGVGTRFLVTVPLSVAVTQVLLFRVGHGRYALPAQAIHGVVDAAVHPVVSGRGGPLVHVGQERLRLVRLAPLLDEITRDGAPGGRLLVVDVGGERIALADSSAHEQRDVVLKTGPFFEHVGVVGAGVPLEDGSLALLLRPSALGEGHASAPAPSASPRPRPLHHRQVLVVEDSPVVRDLVVEALRAYGLRVCEAADGDEACAELERTLDVDLVLTDLEMPRMDGLALLRWLRARPGRRIPVVVLSMRGSDADRASALAAGADGYLVKSDFSHAGLWAALSPYLGGAGAP